jgi:O-antigen/teichoic acid export membrane protein
MIFTLAQRVESATTDSLYRNSFFLMGGTLIAAAMGFLFWLVCAHFYSAEQIGMAGTLISATSLLTNLSFLGFNNTLVRYLSSAHDKSSHVSTAIIITVLAGTILAFLYLAGLRLLLPGMANTLGTWGRPLVVLYVACAAASAMFDSMFVAERTAQVLFYKNILVSTVKLFLPLVFIPGGFMGLFLATALALFVGTIYSAFHAYRRGIRMRSTINHPMLKEVRKFTLGNYIAGIFGILPTSLVPIVVNAGLGAKQAAFFFIPLTIAGLLNVIPSASAQSLFAEASHDSTRLHIHVRKAVGSILALLLPAIVLVVVFGHFALFALGRDYAAQGTTVLRLLAAASIFGAVNYIGDTLLNMHKQVKAFILMNALNAGLVLTAVYLMMHEWGLIGAAAGWLTGQALTMLVYAGLYGQRELTAVRRKKQMPAPLPALEHVPTPGV